ncbi:hypothetical protein MHAS_04166 [Mycolicibacterium hassiacum DSM 44199]|nr:hypothetical protein MHAS_04166 [Mycolicibacterium hassiacum DSM 44199]
MSLPPPGGPFPPPPPPWPGFPAAGQPQSRPGPPPAPGKRGRARKWVLGGITVVAVIAVTAAITVVVSRGSGDGASTPPAETYGLASADDKGPVAIITEEPTCAPWDPIRETMAQSQRQGWADRDINVPATEWSPELRAEYERVANASTAAADQLVALAKATPHRVMRELYELFIAYARAYAASIPTYTAKDNHLAGVMISASRAITLICSAITYGAAAARVILIEPVEPPTRFEPLHDPADSKPFMPEPDPVCSEWYALGDRLEQSPVVQAWVELNGDIPASHWTPEQRDIHLAAAQFLDEFADQIEQAARRSDNPVLQDLAILSAQYRRAYAAAMPTYVLADSFLEGVGAKIFSLIWAACHAAEK